MTNQTTKNKKTNRPQTLVDSVYEEVRNRILYNVFETDRQILEQELAEELGASRTPVREALIRLQRDGLVQVIPRHGMRVLPISTQDVQETYQILSSLESLAVSLAATRELLNKDFRPLIQASKKMDAMLKAKNLHAWADADESFHRHLVELSGNRILVDVHDNFWSRAQRARLTMLSVVGPPSTSTKQHDEILDAIKQNDPKLARKKLEHHLGNINRYVRNMSETDHDVDVTEKTKLPSRRNS